MILLTGDLAEGVVTLKLTQQWPVIWGGVAGRIYLSWGEHYQLYDDLLAKSLKSDALPQ